MANHSEALGGQKTLLAGERKTTVAQSGHHQRPVRTRRHPESDQFLEDILLDTAPAETLTRCQTEILKLIVAGNTNKVIAREIDRTERTVEYRRRQLMRKLGADNTADLVKRAITMGIV